MSQIKKHIHGITGALIFLGFGIAILFLAGFTTVLPLPEEETVLIDFSTKSKSGELSSDDKSKSETSQNERMLVQNFENSEFIHVDGQNNNPSETNTDKINNLFSNPFNHGNGDNLGDDNNPDNGNGDNNGPDNIVGKLNVNRSVTKVSPVAKDNSFGKVVLEITVNELGNVIDVKLVSSTCDECVQSAKDAVKKWKYQAVSGSGLQTGLVTVEFVQN